MAANKPQIISAEVREVLAQFERWRSSRRRREPIPVRLWGMAAKLCETYSLNRVARCLRLNYGALKEEVVKRSPPRPGSRPRHRRITAQKQPAFVELIPRNLPAGILPGNSSVEYVVEAPAHRGGIPRIHVRGANVLEVAALVRALRNGEAT